eukprot:scaffold143637_cov39-Prasinocladus_malaysianus.AAC.1
MDRHHHRCLKWSAGLPDGHCVADPAKAGEPSDHSGHEQNPRLPPRQGSAAADARVNPLCHQHFNSGYRFDARPGICGGASGSVGNGGSDR